MPKVAQGTKNIILTKLLAEFAREHTLRQVDAQNREGSPPHPVSGRGYPCHGKGAEKLRWCPLKAAAPFSVIDAISNNETLRFSGVLCTGLDPAVPDLKFGVVALEHNWRLCAFLSDANRVMLLTGAFKSSHDKDDGYKVPTHLWTDHNKKLFEWEKEKK